MPDFSDETAVALRCHRVEPTIADVIERIVEGNWTYSIDLVYRADGPTHMATIQTRSIHRPKTLARSESVDPFEALAGALVPLRDRDPIGRNGHGMSRSLGADFDEPPALAHQRGDGRRQGPEQPPRRGHDEDNERPVRGKEIHVAHPWEAPRPPGRRFYRFRTVVYSPRC